MQVLHIFPAHAPEASLYDHCTLQSIVANIIKKAIHPTSYNHFCTLAYIFIHKNALTITTKSNKLFNFAPTTIQKMDALIDFFIEWGYIGLFLSALIAGSILPFSSEVVLTVLVQMGADPTISLLSASIGNTVGGLICYWLGYLGNMEWIERWLKIDKQKMDKVSGFVQRRGAWMGLFGVLPWVGEVIIVLLGLMRANVYITTITMFIGKFIRYLLLLYALQGINSLF